MFALAKQAKWNFVIFSIYRCKNWMAQKERFVQNNSTISIDEIVLLCYNISSQGKEALTMSITVTELKLNLAKYLLLSATEDIYITKNGKIVSKLTNPFQERVDIAKSLFGILPADITLEEAQKERLDQI